MEVEHQSLQEENTRNPVVMRLKSWKEFFDLDEFRSGIAAMQKSNQKKTTKAQQEGSEEEGSDSEPSVDNFDEKELEEHLGAAIDEQDEAGSPFFKRPETV